MAIFIKRKFENIKNNEIETFNTITQDHNQSSITVILGEPASGKTYQLKEYSKKILNRIL